MSHSRVLFVDDEPLVLEALRRNMRGKFDADFAVGGDAAIELLERPDTSFAVLCTDMRMPNTDGLTVLKRFRELSPETTRVLLTGQADLESAMAAVNEGNVFRFLLKPVDPDLLAAALTDALEYTRLRLAEQELLTKTLRGSVQALFGVLCLANPVAFARAVRIRALVVALLEHLEVENAWEIEIAAMLSQMGAVTLPSEVCDRLNRGLPLGPEDTEMVGRLPDLADRLIVGIPRLEHVQHMIWAQTRWEQPDTPLGTKLIVFASELDTLTQRNLAPSMIVEMLTAQAAAYGSAVMSAFAALGPIGASARPLLLVSPSELRVGMILAADVLTRDRILVVGRGQEVDERMLTRLVNLEQMIGLEQDQVVVFDPEEPSP